MALHILSAGAAKGLVDALAPEFLTSSGTSISGHFSAVGAIEQRFLSGEACDVLILTAAQIETLTRAGRLTVGSSAPLGMVHTSVAVPAGHAQPMIATTESLRAAFSNATALYVPDMETSTAGRHVKATLAQLGIADAMQPKLRMFPNGETAMRQLATDAIGGALGCTQITEIRNTPGLAAVGPLPPPHQLATVYAAAVANNAKQPVAACQLVVLLTGDRTRTIRERCGFA